MSSEIRYAQTRDGKRIAYCDRGEGLPIIHLTPFGAGSLEFERLPSTMRYMYGILQDRHRLIRFDPRGTGQSDRDVEEFTLEALCLDIHAVAEAAGGDSPSSPPPAPAPSPSPTPPPIRSASPISSSGAAAPAARTFAAPRAAPSTPSPRRIGSSTPKRSPAPPSGSPKPRTPPASPRSFATTPPRRCGRRSTAPSKPRT